MKNPDPLLDVRRSADYLDISTATFWRRVRDGSIPQPIRLGGMSRWKLSTIQAVIDKAEKAAAAA